MPLLAAWAPWLRRVPALENIQKQHPKAPCVITTVARRILTGPTPEKVIVLLSKLI